MDVFLFGNVVKENSDLNELTMTSRYLFFIQQPYSYGILRPLQTAIREQGGEVAWFLNGAAVYSQQLLPGEVQLTSVQAVKDYQPKAVFVPGNVVPDFFPGLKVQVFHGLEWKKKGHFGVRGFFDLYCTHGPITTDKFQQLSKQQGYFQAIETGWPKLDPCFDLPKRENNQRPVILFAPTFSPALTSAQALLSQWQRLSQTGDYRIFVKFHPKMAAEVLEQYQAIVNDNLIISDEDSLIPLIDQADLVVSDTSSAVSEALLMGKVVVTFNNAQPEPYLLDFSGPEQLETQLEKGLTPTDRLLEDIEGYIQQVHPYRDGKSSHRVLAAVDQALSNGVKRKPLNLHRRYKIRKSLSYMRWS